MDEFSSVEAFRAAYPDLYEQVVSETVAQTKTESAGSATVQAWADMRPFVVLLQGEEAAQYMDQLIEAGITPDQYRNLRRLMPDKHAQVRPITEEEGWKAKMLMEIIAAAPAGLGYGVFLDTADEERSRVASEIAKGGTK